jgi:hypothetical protein
MAAWSIRELKTHRHHRVTIQGYHLGEPVLECLDCDVVLCEFHDDKFGILQLGPHPEDHEPVEPDAPKAKEILNGTTLRFQM